MSQVKNREGSDFIIFSPFCFYVEHRLKRSIMTIIQNEEAFHWSNILNAFTGHRFAFSCNIVMGVLGQWDSTSGRSCLSTLSNEILQ